MDPGSKISGGTLGSNLGSMNDSPVKSKYRVLSQANSDLGFRISIQYLEIYIPYSVFFWGGGFVDRRLQNNCFLP